MIELKPLDAPRTELRRALSCMWRQQHTTMRIKSHDAKKHERTGWFTEGRMDVHNHSLPAHVNMM